MLDNRLIEADATKLDELRGILKAQENSDKLCGIGMKERCSKKDLRGCEEPYKR